MAPLAMSNLGIHQRRNTRATSTLSTFPVRVRRQDTTIHHVMLMDELKHFLDVHEPVIRKPLVYPPSFQYDQRSLFHTQGFPEVAGSHPDMQREWRWRQYAGGHSAEGKVFKSLETVFQSRTSLMWNSLESEKVFQVAKESVRYDTNQRMRKMPHLLLSLIHI